MENKKDKSFLKLLGRHPQLATLIGLIAIFIFFSVARDTFLTLANMSNVINQTATIAITGFGITMVLLTAGIDLSIGGVMALVCVVCAKLLGTSMPVGLVMVIGLGLGALIGLCSGSIIAGFGIQPFLTTMGMVNIARGIAKYMTNGQSIFINADGFRNVISQGTLFGLPVLTYWIILLMVITYILISRTTFGRQVQAVGGNEQAAFFSGVKTKRVKIIVYTLMGLYSAFAGIVTLSRLSSGLPTVANGAEMDAIAASVLGGTGFAGEGGNVFGTLMGAFLIGMIVNGLTIMSVNSFLQEVIKGLIIIGTVIMSVKLSSINKAD